VGAFVGVGAALGSKAFEFIGGGLLGATLMEGLPLVLVLVPIGLFLTAERRSPPTPFSYPPEKGNQ
jgi:hypothetical protein